MSAYRLNSRFAPWSIGLLAVALATLPYCTKVVLQKRKRKQDDKASATPADPFETVRPQHVLDALDKDEPLYYFAMGSNMLKSKLQNRSRSGKIEFISMQAAVVPNHRLAFNLRAFPPLEPGMGAVEPVDSDSKPLLAYEKPEVHGALIHLTAEMYERVMKSEGIGSERSGYEEVLVQAYPYSDRSKAVTAVTLRAKEYARLQSDPSPSVRYMTMLRTGAAELGLDQCYQDFLHAHPTEHPSPWLRPLSRANMIFSLTISKYSRRLYIWQRKLVFLVYVPSSSHVMTWNKRVSRIATAVVLLPGATLGSFLYVYYQYIKKEFPAPLGMMLGITNKSEEAEKKQQAAESQQTTTTTTTESDNVDNASTTTTPTTNRSDSLIDLKNALTKESKID